jgi:hypothetical protein
VESSVLVDDTTTARAAIDVDLTISEAAPAVPEDE